MYVISTTSISLPSRLHQKFSNLTSLRVEHKNSEVLPQNILNDTQERLELFQHLYLNANKIKKIEKKTLEKLTNLDQMWLNDTELNKLHSELEAQNKNLKAHYANKNIIVIATEKLTIPSEKAINKRGSICINKWEVDSKVEATQLEAEQDCYPTVEDLHKSSVTMAKIIHELSSRDGSLHKEIAAYQEIICELKESLLNKCRDNQDKSISCKFKAKLLQGCHGEIE